MRDVVTRTGGPRGAAPAGVAVQGVAGGGVATAESVAAEGVAAESVAAGGTGRAAGGERDRRRGVLRALAAMWPAGLLLTVLNMEADIPLAAFLALDAGYVAVMVALLWRLRDVLDGATVALVGSFAGLFALVAWAGPPTAAEPGAYLANTGVLLGVAVVLLLTATHLVVARRAAGAVPALMLFLLGSTVYVANLVGRVAVVLSGAAPQQAAREETAWTASEYLRGLPPGTDWMGYLLTWMDLLQLGYVVTAYVAFAALAGTLHRSGEISRRARRVVVAAAAAGSAAILLGVTAAAALPRELDAVPAWAAFVASIPFMTTLLPFALGLALLSRHARA